MFERYQEYLETDFSDDYWSDECIGIAIEILGKFLPEDWISLSNSWRCQSRNWKIRCAETLDGGLTDPGFAILLSMARDSDEELVMIALESLGSFPASPQVAAIRQSWKPGRGKRTA